MKTYYKQLQKGLDNKWSKPKGQYGLPSAVGTWLHQCNIKPHPKHLIIICKIFDGVPYPHQASDRLEVLNFLENYKYEQLFND